MRFVCLFRFLFLIGFAAPSFQVSTPTTSFYKAGVVEFAPAKYTNSSLDQLNDNLEGYLEILHSDEASETDIIIFPELTLYNVQHLTYVPDPKDQTIPCKNPNYQQFFQKLSCAAQDTKKYVVINLLEKEDCTAESQANKNDTRSCAKDGLNRFNTNVVFNRNGMVIARYRKYNSYDLTTNVTQLPELSTFDTDFGVKFGMFICFDINFYSPAMELVKAGVKDFIFNSFWFSELPFLTATQLQQSWSYANEVNMLAAGASFPSGGTTGSGIYSGNQGALVSVMATSPQRRLYVANVTKSSHWNRSESCVATVNLQHKRNNVTGIRLMREYRMEAFTSKFLDLNDDLFITEKLCHELFCCHFNLTWKENYPQADSSSYKYHLAAYDGDRNYSGFGYTKYKFCAIYACINRTLDSCGRVFDDNIKVDPEIIFKNISIEADFPKADKILIMPNSLDQNLGPLTTDRFKFDVTDKKNIHHVKYTLSRASDDLLTFGIYANYYDSGLTSGSSALDMKTLALLLVLVSLLTFKLCSGR